jgi:hypothetical protein
MLGDVIAMEGNDSSSAMATLLPDLFTDPPAEDWCFDLLMFYRSEEDEQAQKVLHQLETWVLSANALSHAVIHF